MSNEKIKSKEKLLEELEVEEEISQKRMTIAQRKALEREARRTHGRDWKKVLGITWKAIRGLKPDMETTQTLYGVGLGGKVLREQGDPRRFKKK